MIRNDVGSAYFSFEVSSSVWHPVWSKSEFYVVSTKITSSVFMIHSFSLYNNRIGVRPFYNGQNNNLPPKYYCIIGCNDVNKVSNWEYDLIVDAFETSPLHVTANCQRSVFMFNVTIQRNDINISLYYRLYYAYWLNHSSVIRKRLDSLGQFVDYKRRFIQPPYQSVLFQF